MNKLVHFLVICIVNLILLIAYVGAEDNYILMDDCVDLGEQTCGDVCNDQYLICGNECAITGQGNNGAAAYYTAQNCNDASSPHGSVACDYIDDDPSHNGTRFKCCCNFVENCNDRNDNDGDGYIAICDADCRDDNEDIQSSPNQPYISHLEVCDGFDNDCDGRIDNLESGSCVEEIQNQLNPLNSPFDWNVFANSGVSFRLDTLVIDASHYQSGEYCNGTAWIQTPIGSAEDGKNYTLSFKFKKEQTVMLKYNVTILDGEGSPLDPPYIGITDTQEYTEFQYFNVNFTVNNNNDANSFNVSLCHYNGDGELEIDEVQLEQSSVPTQYIQSEPVNTCCPADRCWNGQDCITSFSEEDAWSHSASDYPHTYPDYREKFTAPLDEEHENLYACRSDSDGNADWHLIYKKYSPDDETNYGYCYHNTQCWSNHDPDLCIDDGDFIEGDFCDKGEWHSRMKFMLLQLINHTKENVRDTNYSLICDGPSNILEDFSNVDDIKSICVLKWHTTSTNQPERVVVGIDLESGVVADEFIYTAFNYENAECEGVSNNEYAVCDSNKIWYNNITKSIIYSNYDIDLNPGIWDEIRQFLEGPIEIIVNAIYGLLTPTRQWGVASYDHVESVPFFDKAYLSNYGGKEIFGILNQRVLGKEYLTLNYLQFQRDICRSVNAKYPPGEVHIYYCKHIFEGENLDDRAYVLSKETTLSEWLYLTSMLRVQDHLVNDVKASLTANNTNPVAGQNIALNATAIGGFSNANYSITYSFNDPDSEDVIWTGVGDKETKIISHNYAEVDVHWAKLIVTTEDGRTAEDYLAINVISPQPP